jgi:hypothetical protein
MSDKSGKAPSQAGKFKPRKPAARRATGIRAPTSTNSSGNGRGTSPGRGRSMGRGDSSDSFGRGRGSSSGRGASGGRDGRGRGGRGGGRGRGRGGRGGRFSAPKGTVFFTGGQAGPATAGAKKGATITQPVAEAVDEGTVFMPGMGTSASSRGGKASSVVGKTAQERMAASSLARSGEGEETIVGEMEEGAGIGDGKTKKSILESSGTSDRMGPSMFDDDEEEEVELSAAAYTYDSDSSTDGEPKRAAAILNQKKRRDGRTFVPLQPHRLPFPPTRKPGTEELEILYKSQLADAKDDLDETDIMTDPPLRPPFLDLRTASAEQRKEEQFSWMTFKLPTRLPRLAPHCTLSGRAMKNESGANNESTDDFMGGVDPGDMDMPDAVPSSTTSAPIATPTVETTATSGFGFDDTLKDAAPGKYGKIVVHKSGKAYLIVGGSDSKTPQVKMLLNEGLPCGFLQQAVAIDANQASYAPLGEVKKTIVVTPDIESSFNK